MLKILTRLKPHMRETHIFLKRSTTAYTDIHSRKWVFHYCDQE